MNIKLSSKNKDILGKISLHADKSLRELAKISNHQLHSVNYIINKLEEEKILKRTWIINYLKLSWQRYQIVFSCGIADKKKIIKYFTNRRRVVHLNEIGGEYDFDLVFLARSASDVLCLLQEATQECGNIFSHRVLAIHGRTAYFNRKHFCSNKIKYDTLDTGRDSEPYEMDEIEQKILETLGKSPKILRKDLASELKISIPTLNQRIDKLQKNQVILGCMFSPNYNKLGLQNYRLLISTNSLSKNFSDQMFNFARKQVHVTSYRESIGEWDYELYAEVENYEQLINLKEELREVFENNLTRIQIIPRLKSHKFVSYPIFR